MDTIKQSSFFNVAIKGSLDWSLIHQPRFRKIYRSACNQTWNPDQDLNWDDQGFRPLSPYRSESLPISGFPEFESLAHEKKLALSWQCHSMEISELLHGEQLALIISAQLVNEAPSFAAKMAASAQVSDEARHLDFFSQYMTKFNLPVSPPSQALTEFASSVVNDARPDFKCLACQILLESMAMAKFEELKDDTTITVLQNALSLIIREEARHIGSGSHWLKSLHQNLSASELAKRLRYLIDKLLTLSESDLLLTSIAKQEGWCERSLKQHLRLKRQNDPNRKITIRKHLASALTRCGLLTKETRNMIMGILIDNDTAAPYH